MVSQKQRKGQAKGNQKAPLEHLKNKPQRRLDQNSLKNEKMQTAKHLGPPGKPKNDRNRQTCCVNINAFSHPLSIPIL